MRAGAHTPAAPLAGRPPGRTRTAMTSLLDQALVSGTNFLTAVLLVRVLGLEGFGRFAIAWSIVLLVSGVQLGALVRPMMSVGPKQPADEAPGYFGAVLAQQTGFAAGVFVLVLAGAHAAHAAMPHWRADALALPLACACGAFLAQDFLRRYFFVRERSGDALVNDAISYLGQLAVLLAAARWAQLDAARALWIVAATSALAAAVGAVRAGPVSLHAGAIGAVARRHWGFARWLLLEAQIRQVGVLLPVWSLGLVAGSAAVGVLSACVQLFGVLHVLWLGLENVLQPAAARALAASGIPGLVALGRRAIPAAAVPVVLFCALIAAFPDAAARLVYGERLAGYAHVFVLFAVSYLFAFCELPPRYLLVALERTSGLATAEAIKAGTLALLCVPVAMAFGLTGMVVLIAALSLLGAVLLWAVAWPVLRGAPRR